ncbi:MAG: hypothetical protein MRY32_01170 [Rickettsiales bacterium]|nr:hypothetical protein [Rickettsiales bacterium]
MADNGTQTPTRPNTIREMISNSVSNSRTRTDSGWQPINGQFVDSGREHSIFKLKGFEAGSRLSNGESSEKAFGLRLSNELLEKRGRTEKWDCPAQTFEVALKSTTHLTPAPFIFKGFDLGQTYLQGVDRQGQKTGIEVIKRMPGFSLERWMENWKNRQHGTDDGARHALMERLVSDTSIADSKMPELQHLIEQVAELGWYGLHRIDNQLAAVPSNILIEDKGGSFSLHLVNLTGEHLEPYAEKGTVDKTRAQNAIYAVRELLGNLIQDLAGEEAARSYRDPDAPMPKPNTPAGRFLANVKEVYRNSDLIKALKETYENPAKDRMSEDRALLKSRFPDKEPPLAHVNMGVVGANTQGVGLQTRSPNFLKLLDSINKQIQSDDRSV